MQSQYGWVFRGGFVEGGLILQHHDGRVVHKEAVGASGGVNSARGQKFRHPRRGAGNEESQRRQQPPVLLDFLQPFFSLQLGSVSIECLC